jgi:hypothetical protein
MKKVIVILGVLAVIIITAMVFNFCTKQTETQTGSYGHNNKVHKVTSKKITLPSGQCVILQIVCTKKSCDTCVIDGNFYPVDCDNPVIDPNNVGTYHIQNNGNGWIWGLDQYGNKCSCTTKIPAGLTENDLLGIVNDPNFPVNCCDAGSSTTTYPCDPVRFYGHISTGECVVWALQCCGGKISGEYYITDCLAGVPKSTHVFCATYSRGPNDYNDLSKWTWCGDPNAPNDILDILKSAYLMPCIQ